MMLAVQNLSFSYGARQVLKDISFQAQKGEMLSLLGPNGVGKSTLFHCMLGLLKGYQGEIRVDGSDVNRMKPRELAQKIAYIPQVHSPAFSYSVRDMVLMGATGHMAYTATPGKVQREAANHALDRMGILGLANRSFSKLSGGERQLVLMARAMVQDAHIWFLDEPTASLDYGNQFLALHTLQRLAEEGYLICLSIHNPDHALRFATRVIAMLDGGILADGIPHEVLDDTTLERLYRIPAKVHTFPDGRRVCMLG